MTNTSAGQSESWWSTLAVPLEQAYKKEGLVREWHRERETLKECVELIAGILPSARYEPSGVLGVGGFGVVLRVKDSLFPSIDNALKFPRPIEGVASLVAEMMGKELRFLSTLRHSGVVRMLYYRVVQKFEPFGAFPFYLMEVVEGEQSGKYFQRPDVGSDAFLRIVEKVARTLEYLHTAADGPYVHLDIKPENIAISSSGEPVLLDLGTCKKADGSSEKTVLAFTNAIAHPDLVKVLQSARSEETREFAMVGNLDRASISTTWDLWAFGRTLLQWMGVQWETGEVADGAFAERLDPFTRKYMRLLCLRLLTDAPRSWTQEKVGLSVDFVRQMPITDAKQLVQEIGKLVGSYNPLGEVPELDVASTGSIQAAPGVHVTNTSRLKQTLEHRLFRRLNSITQLGIVSQVFPGAKHARREHSLGTYGNVCRMLRSLYADATSPLFKQWITDGDVREVLLAALLHDLGQFPLAHDLEDVDGAVFDHESLTHAMLKGDWRKAKAGSRRIEFEDLSAIFALWGTTPERIVSVLNARTKSASHSSKDKLLRSMISGPIDADKLDYLFRDARYTDVPYPNGIDVERLYRCLTTVVVEKSPSGARDVPVIGVYAKGRIAAEFMTMARYAMFSQVYWHHAVRAQKSMLGRAVGALIAKLGPTQLNELRDDFVEMVWQLPESMFRRDRDGKQLPLDPDHKPLAPQSHIGVGTDLVASDAAVLTWLRDRLALHGLPEALLLQRLLTRSLYKRLWVFDRPKVSEDWDQICRLWHEMSAYQRDMAAKEFESRVASRLNVAAVSVTTLAAADAKGLVQELTASRSPWLLADVPATKSGADLGLYYVTEVQARKLRKDDRVLGDLQKSGAWEQYSRDLRIVAGNIRIFCQDKLLETVDASIKPEEAFEDLLAIVLSVGSTQRVQKRTRKARETTI